MAVLRYGNNLSIELDFADGVVSDEFGVARGEPLANTTAAVMASLHEPVDYPALSRSLTPADRVVLALDHGVPQLAQVTAAIVHELIEAEIEPENITVLQPEPHFDWTPSDPCRLVAKPLRERIKVIAHDPSDRRQLAYLAANEAGDAILVHRALHEADVVLPVGCLRADDAAGYFGIHSTIFPAFSDAKTLQRFRSFGSLNGHGARKRELTAEVDHVAWVLGIYFTIQIVPTAGDRALHVLTGESEAVRRRGRELYRAAWSWPVTRRATLVVASIEGDAEQQTWENVGRAIETASHYAEDDGAIVVCCELAAAPGPALRRIACAATRESGLRHVGKDRPVDALPAAQLAHAQQQHRVYLLSRLDPATVEDLDVIPVAGPDELVRLVHQHSSCVLLSNAPYVTSMKEEIEPR